MILQTLALCLLLLAVCEGSGPVAGKYAKKGGDFFTAKSEHGDKLTLSLSGSYGMNTCQIDAGPMKLENHRVLYTDPDDQNCHVRVTFKGKTAVVDQQGECGCGLNVNLSGTYRKEAETSGKRTKPTSEETGKPRP